MPFASLAFEHAKDVLVQGGHPPIIPVHHLTYAGPVAWRPFGLLRVFQFYYRLKIWVWLAWPFWRLFTLILGYCLYKTKIGEMLRGPTPGQEFALVSVELYSRTLLICLNFRGFV
jgi:hypothetical protein